MDAPGRVLGLETTSKPIGCVGCPGMSEAKARFF